LVRGDSLTHREGRPRSPHYHVDELLGWSKTAGVIRNITDRKQRERRLEAQVTAMKASIDGMAILDESDTYVFVNQAYADIYGYDSPDAFLGET
jgi:PAS domain-containing protein